MTAEIKIAQGKLTLLQLAEKLKNISEACRRKQISRSQFYEYKGLSRNRDSRDS